LLLSKELTGVGSFFIFVNQGGYMAIIGKSKPEVTIEATVIRADGTRENLGVIAYNKNITLKRKAISLLQKLKGGN
jgi:hypothetical protein